MAETYNRQINIWINGKEVRNSITSIRKEFYAAKKELDLLTRGSEEYNKKAAEVRNIRAILDEHTASLKQSGGMWGKIKDMIPIASFASAAAALVGFGKELFDLSKTMESEARRSSIVFGDSLGYVQGEAEKVASKMGVTRKEFVAMAAATGDLLVPLGFTRQRAAEMSVELQKLTGALDEWTGGQLGAKNISEILTKAMLGENEQLKQLGIAIRLDSDEYKDLLAQKMKIPGVTKAQAQAMAELELIQAKSLDAQNAYTQGGNELMRTQKSLAAGWRSMKEGIVELFSQDAVGKLKEENKMVNALTMELYNQNTPQERRLQIYKQLQAVAPEIVATLDSEMRATIGTRKALEDYNKALINKIILAKNDKEIARRNEDVAKATAERMKIENDAMYAMQLAADQDKRFAPRINEVLAESTTAVEKLKKLKSEGIDVSQGMMLKVLNDAISAEEESNAKLQGLFDERIKIMNRLGMSVSQAPAAAPVLPAASTTTTTTKNTVETNSVKNQVTTESIGAALDTAFTGLAGGAADTTYAAPQTSDLTDELAAKSQAMHDQAMADFEWEQGIEDERTKAKQERQQQYNEELKKQRDFEIQLEQEKNAYKMDLLFGAFNLGSTLIGRQMSKLDEQYKADIAAAGDNAAAKEKIEKDYQKRKSALQRKAAIVEKAASLFNIAINTAVAVSKATAEFMFPLIPWIIASGAMQAATVIAQPVPQFAAGGFTKKGGKYEPAGVVHAGEWVASAEMVASPVTGPIIKALENSRLTRQFADGGMVTASQEPAAKTQQAQVITATDPDLKKLIAQNTALLQKLQADGVSMRFGWREADQVRNGIKKIDDIETAVSR